MPRSGIRLHLGCGADPRPGFVNIDRAGPGADLRMDVARLALRSGSAQRIEALHLVEHLGYLGTLRAFAEWHRVLRPGGRLVLETPDFPESARRFVAADFAGRARLANWIFGLESPGMEHRFGFEAALLRRMLTASGFVRVRAERPRTHPDFPGLRLVAVRGDDPAAEVRARFVLLLFERGIGGPEQSVRVEVLHELVPDLFRSLGRRPDRSDRVDAALVRLAVADPELARAALEAARPRFPPDTLRVWDRLLAAPSVGALPARLAAEWLRRPPLPGEAEAAFRALRSRARSWMAARVRAARAGVADPLPDVASFLAAARRPGLDPVPPPLDAPLLLRPFLRSGLARTGQHELVLGLRHFAAGRLDEAAGGLHRATALLADSPFPFWNLARLEVARRRPAAARRHLDRAVEAAARRGSPALPLLRAERDRLAAGRRVSPLPVSPVAVAGPGARR